jgi:hypothetical protein
MRNLDAIALQLFNYPNSLIIGTFIESLINDPPFLLSLLLFSAKTLVLQKF